MEMVYYTVVAVLLYLVSDWLLTRIEIYKGARLANRSIYFFTIIMVLSVGSFSLISALYEKPVVETSNTTTAPATAEPSSVPD